MDFRKENIPGKAVLTLIKYSPSGVALHCEFNVGMAYLFLLLRQGRKSGRMVYEMATLRVNSTNTLLTTAYLKWGMTPLSEGNPFLLLHSDCVVRVDAPRFPLENKRI